MFPFMFQPIQPHHYDELPSRRQEPASPMLPGYYAKLLRDDEESRSREKEASERMLVERRRRNRRALAILVGFVFGQIVSQLIIIAFGVRK